MSTPTALGSPASLVNLREAFTGIDGRRPVNLARKTSDRSYWRKLGQLVSLVVAGRLFFRSGSRQHILIP
jgi:hypothetical protein